MSITRWRLLLSKLAVLNSWMPPMSSLMAKIDMTSARFEKPKEEITSVSYNALSGIPIDVTTPPNSDIRINNKPAPCKGPWTGEVDR